MPPTERAALVAVADGTRVTVRLSVTSFYVFKPDMLRVQGNRLAGKIGIYVMEKHKMFQIDNPQDIVLCQAIMRGYGLDK